MSDIDYEKLRDEIGSRPVQGLTVAEAAGLLRDYSKYERLAVEQAIRKQRRTASPAAPTFESKPEQTDNISRQKKWNESLVGRYVMTIAAAILCVLGAGVFVSTFWPVLPDPIKFCLILLCGLGAWALGISRSNKPMRPFWLGVAGAGAGVSLLAVIAGTMIWYLYDPLLAGVLCLAWTGACFIIAKRSHAWLFYLIAYLGGGVTVSLSSVIAAPENRLFGEVVYAIVVTVVLLMGWLAWRTAGKPWPLAAMWLAGCWLAGQHASGWFFRPYGDGCLPDSSISIVMFLCGLLGAVSVWWIDKVISKTWRHRWAAVAALAFCNAFFVYDMADTLFPYRDAAGILTAGILLSGLAVNRTDGYLLGIAIPVARSLIGCDGSYGILIAAALAMAGAFYSNIAKSKFDRTGIVLAWACGIQGVLDLSYQVRMDGWLKASCCMAVLFLTTALAIYITFRRQWDDWLFGRASRLAAVCGGLAVIITLAEIWAVPDWVPVCILALSFNAFRRFYKKLPEDPYHAISVILCGILCILATAALSGLCVFNGLLRTHTELPARICLTGSIFLIAVMDLYGMFHSVHKIQGLLACLAANWCLWLSAFLWALEARAAVSAVGILLSAMFVAAGFHLDRKAVRQMGLYCALLYALKLGLFDMSFNGGLGMAAGFLISGVGCFGISLLYNKLGKIVQADTPGEKHGEE